VVKGLFSSLSAVISSEIGKELNCYIDFWPQNFVKYANFENIALRIFRILHKLYYICIMRGKFSRRFRGEPVSRLQTLQGYIFRILQHFAPKLRNFTNFGMLFLAMLTEFVIV
jgi:hypothetical protein